MFKMVSSGKAIYLEWKKDHPEVVISHVIIEKDGDKCPSQLDGNVYFDGIYVPEITVFGDFYLSLLSQGRSAYICMEKFTIRGSLCMLGTSNQVVELSGFRDMLEKCQVQLPPNVTVIS